MPETLDFHEPLLINTLGHSAGLLIFGIFLYLFLRDWRGARLRRSVLPAMAASLALLWNLGSLIVLAGLDFRYSALTIAFSFSVLSMLPAVLLHLSLENRLPLLRNCGYVLSAAAVILHIAEIFASGGSQLHEFALQSISIGFGSLTTATLVVFAGTRRPQARGMTPRILASMASFLFAMSFVHFSSSHGAGAWSSEVAFHHAGIPLALLVLVQEYRFLLLDTFLRFLVNAALAAAAIVLAVAVQERFEVLRNAGESPFYQAILIVVACLALILFAYLRSSLQSLLTRVVFRRTNLEQAAQRLRRSAVDTTSTEAFLDEAARIVAEFVAAERHEWRSILAGEWMSESEPVSDPARWKLSSEDRWVEAVVPVRLTGGDTRLLLFGRRSGGRRYLSEDLQSLNRLSGVIADEVDRLRTTEVHRLVSQAEFRALQAQINPHFLFNALNTLYGTIPRQAEGARRMVLNLAQIFRYFLRSEKTSIPLAEELNIIEAYLEIERLRLGDRLQTEISISPEAMRVPIPVLSLQPLIENAVKHGVAPNAGSGWVRLKATVTEEGLRVEVKDSGVWFDRDQKTGDGAGIGLTNVRQRLKLCYGPEADISVS